MSSTFVKVESSQRGGASKDVCASCGDERSDVWSSEERAAWNRAMVARLKVRAVKEEARLASVEREFASEQFLKVVSYLRDGSRRG